MTGKLSAANSARAQKVLYPAAVAVLLLAAWQALVVMLKLPPYLVP